MHIKPVRYQGQGCLHFITFSCYHRMPLLDPLPAKQIFERELERVRPRYGCYITGYVVMPEDVHLLISEPEHSKLSVVSRCSNRSHPKSYVQNVFLNSGRSAITIFLCGPKQSASRSCAPFIAIR